MGIMETLRGMKEYEKQHPIISNGKKKAKGLKKLNLKTSIGNSSVEISNGNISKENRRKYIASLLGKRRK